MNFKVTSEPVKLKPSSLTRQQEIENALSMALYHVRHCDSLHGLQTATSKAIRATSMLKQACAESTIVGKI